MKKILSLLLSLIMLLSVFILPVNAEDVPRTNTPVIFIRGASRHLYASDDSTDEETQIFPLNVDLGAVVKEALEPCLTDLALGLITDDYSEYCDEIYNSFAPLYEKVILDKNGEASDGSGDGRKVTDFSAARLNGNYPLMEYDFGFDLRLSPLTIADDLKQYVDIVRNATGKKVSLIGRCFGGNVISAYLAKYPDHAAQNVESVIMYISSTVGIKLIGALFAGELEIDADNLDRFLEYVTEDMGMIEDPDLQSIINAFVDFLNFAEILGLGTDALQTVIDKVIGELSPRLALASYATFPSYWSMVPAEYYERAKSNVFAGKEDEYKGLIEKIDDYYYNVQLTYEAVMKDLEARGVKMSVVAKYDVPIVPVYKTATAQGDFVAETTDISFGAICADTDKRLSEEYINSLTDKRFISPDRKIDASTCLFPEKTWFLKGLFHTDFPLSSNSLLAEIVNGKGELTVFDNESFPQYMVYDKEADIIKPVTGLDPLRPEKGSDEETFSVLLRFITAIFRIFRMVLKGEFNFADIFNKA